MAAESICDGCGARSPMWARLALCLLLASSLVAQSIHFARFRGNPLLCKDQHFSHGWMKAGESWEIAYPAVGAWHVQVWGEDRQHCPQSLTQKHNAATMVFWTSCSIQRVEITGMWNPLAQKLYDMVK